MTLNLPTAAAWAKTQDPDDPTNWVILSYAEGSKTDLTAASGTGGLAEFCAALKDDAIHYGGFVVYGVDGPRGNTTLRREKFVQITWIGANVGVMAKSKVDKEQRSNAMTYFSGHHIACQIMDGDRDELSEAELEKKLLQMGGANTPEYYDFGSGAYESGRGGGNAEAVPAGGDEKKDDGAAEVFAKTLSEIEARSAKLSALFSEERRLRLVAESQGAKDQQVIDTLQVKLKQARTELLASGKNVAAMEEAPSILLNEGGGQKLEAQQQKTQQLKSTLTSESTWTRLRRLRQVRANRVQSTSSRKKLLQVGGARMPEYYDFGGGASEAGGAPKEGCGRVDLVPGEEGGGAPGGAAAGGQKREGVTHVFAAEVAATGGGAPLMLVGEGAVREEREKREKPAREFALRVFKAADRNGDGTYSS